MRVLFCGDRNWTDRDKIAAAFDRLQPSLVIEGEARGADTLAREEAERRGIPVLSFPANWKQYGRAAGPIRNRQMLSEGRPEYVCGFHSSIEASSGTRDMLNQARRLGVPWELVE